MQKMVDIFRKGLRRRIAFAWLLLQTLEANRGDVLRHTGVEQARRHWLGVQDVVQRFSDRLSRKWRPAGYEIE